MGKRCLILAALIACGSPAPATPVAPTAPASLPDRIAADFEQAVKANKDAYVSLFDFVAVGEYEILLRRYKLNGRRTTLTDAEKEMLRKDDGTPFPEARERRNVGNFYPILAQRTVGTGGCTAVTPRTKFGKLLGQPFEPMPADTPPAYEKLRTDANDWLAKGGVVGLRCTGGTGGIAIVYTASTDPRGYKLITIYDD
jgi:hypothetical protein